MLFILSTFAVLECFVFWMAFKTSLDWAPITFWFFEKRPRAFEPTLKRYITVSRIVMGAALGTAAFLLNYLPDAIHHPTIKLWTPECMLLIICAGLSLIFDISASAAYESYRQTDGRLVCQEQDESFRRWYAMNGAVAITALFSLVLAYLGVAATLFG